MSNLQVAHLLPGPLCLLGHPGGQLVLDLPLAHEIRGPHEDLGVPPSRVPLRAPQVLELPSIRNPGGQSQNHIRGPGAMDPWVHFSC